MTIPGVGAVVAMTFRSAVDQPERFAHSKAVGAHFGLTPKKYQSGEIDRTGRISKVGDAMVRTALFEAANVMLTRAVRFSVLKAWALRVASSPRHEEGQSGARPQARRGDAPHVGRWHELSLGRGGTEACLNRPQGPTRQRGPVAGTHGSGEAANPGVAGPRAGPRVLDRLARSI